jgi:hypothetical protein
MPLGTLLARLLRPIPASFALGTAVVFCVLLVLLIRPHYSTRPVSTRVQEFQPTSRGSVQMPAPLQIASALHAEREVPNKGVRVQHVASTPAVAHHASDTPPLAGRIASPAPLTREEKLLLQIARRSDAAEFPMLNPELRAQAEAIDEAEFAKFVAESRSHNE